jgi:hypothetical protein
MLTMTSIPMVNCTATAPARALAPSYLTGGDKIDKIAPAQGPLGSQHLVPCS